MSWPPRWTEPHFKERTSAKVARGLKREGRAARENKHKQEVRRRDKYCRFPLCNCKRFGLAMHVSHQKHKGPGGNPAEDRSMPDIMLLLCSARHKENVFSVDAHTLRWRALTKEGANGPIAWDIQMAPLRRQRNGPLLELAIADQPAGKWFELARETAIHVYEPQTPTQTVILAWLRGMEK